MNKNKHLIIIGGPTASGKTKLSIELAQQLGTEIINADSRQVYKQLHIGVAKPSTEELNTVKHHLIGHVDIKRHYNVGDYLNDAENAVIEVFANHDTAIVCGGTGLYINALLYGIDEIPEVSKETLNEVQQQFDEHGLDGLLKELQEKDRSYYEKVDRANPIRVIRAISVIRASGQPFTTFHTSNTKPKYNYSYFRMDVERAVLYQRIDQRVLDMVEAGLEAEVAQLLEFKELKALQTVGYSEWWPYFEGKYDLATCIQKIQQHTRNYAKRQETWFNNKTKAIPVSDSAQIWSLLNLKP